MPLQTQTKESGATTLRFHLLRLRHLHHPRHYHRRQQSCKPASRTRTGHSRTAISRVLEQMAVVGTRSAAFGVLVATPRSHAAKSLSRIMARGPLCHLGPRRPVCSQLLGSNRNPLLPLNWMHLWQPRRRRSNFEKAIPRTSLSTALKLRHPPSVVVAPLGVVLVAAGEEAQCAAHWTPQILIPA